MTRSNSDPLGVLADLRRLANAMKGADDARKRTDADRDAWRTATTEAGRRHCAEHGHRYQVHGRHDPTKITCPTCGRTWTVAT